jgi:asparagine synthase (glutamine-hydrolysing)
VTMEADELCSALSGVSVRRPFADIDLWEFFLSLRAEDKYPDLRSKTLMRRLLRGRLPDEILDRRKKTFFDDHVMAHVNYEILRRHLASPSYRVAGVNYRELGERIEKRNLGLYDYYWANKLARIHAFADLYS